jgi:hypothetical protein
MRYSPPFDGSFRNSLDLRTPGFPEGCVALRVRISGCRHYRAVELFTQDVGVSGVPAGFGGARGPKRYTA